MGSPFSWCDVTETSPCCDSLTLLRHAAKITCLLLLLCGNWAPHKPLVQKPPVLPRAVFPGEPFSSAPVSPAPSGACLEGARIAGCQLAPRRGAGTALARPGRVAGRCQERVNGCLRCLSAEQASLGALGRAKGMAKDARPCVRSHILVGWVWGKAWTPISIWLE